MSNITDWIKYELYPTLFERIDIALPEHQFKRYPGGWSSNTYLDGLPHKRADKTVVTKKAPGLILEQGGEVISLVDYVMRRDGVEFIQAVKTLATVSGIQLPKGDFNPESYQKYRDQATILEDANSYFTYCLETSPGAEEVRAYLGSRGYSEEDIKAMELGYIPSQEKLYKYLTENKGYTQDAVSRVVKLNKGIGATHGLTIPYRAGGNIKGFVVRTVIGAEPKYLVSTGLKRGEAFFNISSLKGDKDLVVVEGYLDALIAEVRGLDNIVALGGAKITSEQVRDAKRRGAKSFTLCLDTDEAGKEGIIQSIRTILAEGVNRVYIVTLPDMGGVKTDPDSLIKEKGIQAFKDAIRGAISYYKYMLQDTLNRYIDIEKERGLQDKDIDNLLEEVVETASQIEEATDRDQYKKLFTSLDSIKELGITEESLSITVDRLTSTKEKAAQEREFSRLLMEANKLQSKGETDKALELLDERVKEVRITGAKELLPPALSFSGLLEEIATIPPAYKTGYNSLDKFIGFTPGAMTLIAGRPSHGKTTLMFNLLLQMSRLYQNENFYFFSYEEPVKNISVKLLNRLIDTDLSGYYKDAKGLSKPTNYEFIKHYITAGRTDIGEVEEGKRLLKDLIDSQRIRVIGKNYSVEELSSLIAYLNKREPIGALIIDYIQRMRTERKTQDKRTEIAHISDQVLQIAKDTGLPIILGAQLNRDAKNKPTLENLKEAGNLEEDANTVISVYCKAREEEENIEGEPTSKQNPVELEIKTLKNREGEVNRIERLDWDRWTGVIRDQNISSSFM